MSADARAVRAVRLPTRPRKARRARSQLPLFAGAADPGEKGRRDA